MTRPAAAAIAASLLLTGCGDSGAAAGCVGPQVEATPATLAAGDEVRVTGRWFFDDCYDTGQPGTPPATQDVELRLVTGGDPAQTFVLATVDADGEGRIDTAITLPDDVPAGPARIGPGYGQAADVVIAAS
jgi:hypothetical protein